MICFCGWTFLTGGGPGAPTSAILLGLHYLQKRRCVADSAHLTIEDRPLPKQAWAFGRKRTAARAKRDWKKNHAGLARACATESRRHPGTARRGKEPATAQV